MSTIVIFSLVQPKSSLAGSFEQTRNLQTAFSKQISTYSNQKKNEIKKVLKCKIDFHSHTFSRLMKLSQTELVMYDLYLTPCLHRLHSDAYSAASVFIQCLHRMRSGTVKGLGHPRFGSSQSPIHSHCIERLEYEYITRNQGQQLKWHFVVVFRNGRDSLNSYESSVFIYSFTQKMHYGC